MPGFQQSGPDHQPERRSLSLDDLPTLRDARGEPIVREAGESSDNGTSPVPGSPIHGAVEPPPVVPTGRAVEPASSLSFSVSPSAATVDAPPADPAAAAAEAAMPVGPDVASFLPRRDPPVSRPITAFAPADQAETFMPDIDPKAMRSLLDQAERMMQQLQTGIEEARGTTEEPSRLAEDLQERLRVGARMLTAFQSQIERTETAISEAEDRVEAAAALDVAKDEALEAIVKARKAETVRVKQDLAAALDAARTAIDERARRRDRPAVEVQQIVEQVEEHIAAALRRIDGHVDQRMPDVPSQESIDLRVERSVQGATSRFDRHAAQVRGELETQARAAGELRGQIAATSERVEATEMKADELSARVDETARAMKTEVEEARALARRCLDVRSGLASELRKVVTGMEDVAGRGERMRIDVEEQLDRFEQLRDQVTESLSNLETVVRRVDRVEGTVERLERLADRLAPWQDLLCSGDLTADGLPRPAAELVDRLQSGIGRDVDSLSRTMQEMAERMAGIAGGRRPSPAASPAPAPAPVPAGRAGIVGKPAQTAEARPGGMDLPIPNRTGTSEVLSALQADKRRTTPEAGSPTDETDTARMHLRRTGTS